ncbi:unnamed protein product [Arctogadus glacialis]
MEPSQHEGTSVMGSTFTQREKGLRHIQQDRRKPQGEGQSGVLVRSCKGPRATSYYNEDMGSLCFTRNVYILRTPPLESQWPVHENRGEAL